MIMGVFDMIKQINVDSRLFGFLMGPHGVYSNNYVEVTEEYMKLYRNMGGFDMICKFKLHSDINLYHFYFIADLLLYRFW